MDITVATSRDPARLRSAYHMMALTTSTVIIPLAWTSLHTGILLAAGSKWGLIRHHWVLFSLILTTLAVLVLMIESSTIQTLATTAKTLDDAGVPELPHTRPHSIGGLATPLFVRVLNVYKPKGLTPHGWRRHQAHIEERA